MSLNLDLIPKEEKQRIEELNKILRYYHENDVPNEIIKRINKKFKTTKYNSFIRTEELEKGMMIRAVDLDITKISTMGIVTRFIKTTNKERGNILLYNPYNNTEGTKFWKINPERFYLFHIEKNTYINDQMKSLINEYKNFTNSKLINQ